MLTAICFSGQDAQNQLNILDNFVFISVFINPTLSMSTCFVLRPFLYVYIHVEIYLCFV